MKQIFICLVLATCMAIAHVARSADFDEPVNCKVSGEAFLIDTGFERGQYVNGDVQGTAINAFGSWFHESVFEEGYIFFTLSPDYVSCRINGVQIARSGGRVSDTNLAAGSGLHYVLEVEDQEPHQYWFTALIEASRNADRERVEWEDGSLEGPLVLIIPHELPVTEGSAGNQWATLSFLPTDSDTEVRCRYRGTGATALDPSDRYLLESCVGAGRTLIGGTEVEVEQVSLHLDGSFPNARTTVSLPALVGQTVSDFYVLLIENSSDEVVFSFYGWVDPETGDLAVEDLD